MINFILGIIAGMVLFPLLIYVIVEMTEKSTENNIGEDFVYIRMKKSEMKEFEKMCKEYKQTVDIRSKDGSFQTLYIDKEEKGE